MVKGDFNAILGESMLDVVGSQGPEQQTSLTPSFPRKQIHPRTRPSLKEYVGETQTQTTYQQVEHRICKGEVHSDHGLAVASLWFKLKRKGAQRPGIMFKVEHFYLSLCWC